MQHKNNSFIILLIIFPFILGLYILKFNNFLKGNWYFYLCIILSFIFLIYFVFSLFYALEDLHKKKLKYNYFFLILCPFLYLPYHYGKIVSRKDKYLAYSLIFVNLLLIVGFYFSSKGVIYNYFYNEGEKIILKDIFQYVDKDNIFSIDIGSNYTCSHNYGDYSLICENNLNDSLIGIYTYDGENSEQDFADILSFHLEQTISYIDEQDYEYLEENLGNLTKITYNDMEILLTSRMYLLEDKEYFLIFVYESPIYDDSIQDLENLIETVTFNEEL